MINIQDFFNTIQKAFVGNKPFVAYRNPNEQKVVSLFQESDELIFVKDFKEKGFVFAPFDSSKEAVLLNADKRVEVEIEDAFLKFNTKSNISFPEGKNAQENHTDLVSKAIDFLKSEAISKVVVARIKEIDTEINVVSIFQALLKKYEAAYVYIWFHPKVGLWVGASPEILLKVNSGEFKTMSLAGTQKYTDTLDVNWGSKELEEQQLVTDYVLSNLKSVTKSLRFSKVKTIKAGNLLHLKTDISGDLSESTSLKSIIHTLHPTPAICGFPKEKAQQFIFENENFDRKYYTGFLGELNLQEKTSLFVNLRCMEIVDGRKAKIYVGGGITEKSNAEKEWEETVAKAKTMEASFNS